MFKWSKRFFAVAALTLMAFTPVQVQGEPATSGPDLIVREDGMMNQWLVRNESLLGTYCSVEEGNIVPGDHDILRFTVMTSNIGDEDVYIGDPMAHVLANDGLYEYASCHKHFHFRHYAKYELIDPATGRTWRAAKVGFCMLDTDPNPAHMGQPPGPGKYKSCGTFTSAGNQGVTAGWTDTYRFYLGGQYFVLDGGDGQEPIPSGNYIIRVTVNPGYVPGPGEPCRYADPNRPGVCHQLLETNYENNVTEVPVYIPEHVGREGAGPLADSPHLNYDPVKGE